MKILVIHATAGAGHRKAAEAIAKELKSSGYPQTILADALDYTLPFYKHLYSRSYTLLISYLPWLWGFCFKLIDIPWLQSAVRFLRRLSNGFHGKALEHYLEQENFDVIFSTHFFPNEVAAYLKRRGRITSTIICSVTDFDVHRIWLAEGIDFYTVATPWTREKILSLGVPDTRIAVTGIPTDTKFSQPKNIPELKRRLGLREELLTVLVATGSFGIGPMEEIRERLSRHQVLIICGHNQSLFERLSRTNSISCHPVKAGWLDAAPSFLKSKIVTEGDGAVLAFSKFLLRKARTVLARGVAIGPRATGKWRPAGASPDKGLAKIYGLVDNMDEMMAVSDVIITKPGGLSIAEAMVSGLPMIFFSAIPGQETNNVKVLDTYGIGLSRCPVSKMAEVLNRFCAFPEELQSAKQKSKSLGKPSAVKDIVSLIQKR